MRTVRQVLAAKDPEVYAIGPDVPVIDALRVMAERQIGAVLVMEHDRLAGVLSERDYARKIALSGRSSRQTPVREIMLEQVETVGPDDTVARCMQMMTDGRFRHLPVVDGGMVVGVVSIGDLVKAVLEAQQQELDELQRYIAS